MEEKIGKVIEVFIPDKYKNNVMYSAKIGFKVKLEDEVIELIEEMNEINSNIYKDDIVLIRKQIISGKEFIDIEVIDGEEDE